MPRFWILAACVGALMAGPAFAQQVPAGQQPEVAPACAADAKKLCAGIRPGSGKITECLKKNADSLTPECKATVADGRASVPPSPCKGDIEKLCATVEPGAGRIGECLRKNTASLSASCRVYQVRIKD